MAVIDIYKTNRRYATILCDAPWQFKDAVSRPKQRGGTPYPTMSVDELKALPIERLARDGAELWLWSTNNHLHHAFHLIEAWGFDYRGMRTWVKPMMGIGHWFRSQTEQLLFATYGTPPRRVSIDANGARQRATPVRSTLLLSRVRQRHSQKPRESYEDIEAVSSAPRLELFARRARKGWDSWGDQAKEIDEQLAADISEHIRED